MTIKFRKPQQRKQGLKILMYGEDGSGKSWAALSFPDNAIIDSESKIGVNENNPRFADKIVAIADTSNYYDAIELLEYVLKNPKEFKTLTIDSYTRIYSAVQVACMEVEEERARKKKKDVDDSTLSMRSHGKIKLNVLRFEDYIAQASAKGINVVCTAHKTDIKEKVGDNWIKVGEQPDLKANSKHTFDIVLRFFKEKDIATGEWKYMAEVEKDATNTYKLGTKLENVTYDDFKDYIEANEKKETIEANYDKTFESNINEMKKEQADHDTIVKEFKALYSELVKKDEANKAKVAGLMKAKGVEKYNDSTLTEPLKEVIEEMKKLK